MIYWDNVHAFCADKHFLDKLFADYIPVLKLLIKQIKKKELFTERIKERDGRGKKQKWRNE